MKKDSQNKWQNLSTINQEIIQEKIPTIVERKNELLKSKVHLDNDVSKAGAVYMTKHTALDSLNKASGAIQDAVSNIRKHLAENQRYCPVCQADYEPGDLIERIEVSLNKLNPAIPLAIEDEKNALASLQAAKEKRSKEDQNLLDIDSALNAEQDKLETNRKKISESFLPQFPGLKTPKEANTYIEEQATQIVSEISKLKSNRIQLMPEAAIEEINNSNLKKSEDERSINELTTINPAFPRFYT